MKTTWMITLLLVGSLMLAGCTIQPAVPVTELPAADTAADTAADAAESAATVEGTDTAAGDTATDDTAAATETAIITDTATVTDGAVVTTTTSVMTTTVTTVTEGAAVTDTAVTTPTDDSAAALPTPTPAAPITDAVVVTGTAAVTDAAAVTDTGALTATEVVTDANAGTILQIINSTPGLESLATALTASGMAIGLDEPGAVTFFAPNNDAFAAISADQLNALLADPPTLAPILQYHIVIDNVSTTGLGTLGAALSSSGLPITVTLQADGSLLINDANLVQGDIAAANGVIHIIDAVLMPPAATTTP